MEKRESCFLVYRFYVFFFFLKRKKVLRDDGFKFLYETLHQNAALYTT